MKKVLLYILLLCISLPANGLEQHKDKCKNMNIPILYLDSDIRYNTFHSNIPQSFKKAVNCLDKYCNSGDMESCYSLGVMHLNGFFVKKDIKIALELYKQSCNYGSKDACFDLSSLYFDGTILSKDLAQAFRYAALGCNNGHAKGCATAGFYYEYGMVVSEDQNIAMDYYDKSCKLGEEMGCEKYQQFGAK